MRESVIKNTILFFLLVFLQVVLFDNIGFLGFVNPYVYLIFLLGLPVGIQRNSAMLLAFVLGLCIDMFNNTMGIHTFACVFVTFFRSYWITALCPHNEYGLLSPSIKTFGLSVYLRYATGFIFVHHLWLFFLETLSAQAFWFTMLRVLCNTAVTLLLVVCYELIRPRR